MAYPMIVALPHGIVVEPRDPVENADVLSGIAMTRLSAADPIVVVHNQLGLLGVSRDRERSALGRLYNRITGEDTESFKCLADVWQMSGKCLARRSRSAWTLRATWFRPVFGTT